MKLSMVERSIVLMVHLVSSVVLEVKYNLTHSVRFHHGNNAAYFTAIILFVHILIRRISLFIAHALANRDKLYRQSWQPAL